MIKTFNVTNLEFFFKKIKSKKIFIITGKNSYIKTKINRIIKSNLEKDNEIKIYFKTQYLPTVTELNKIIKEINKFKPEIIFAVGGGSVLDLAKSSNYLHNCKNIKKYILNENKKNYFNFCNLTAIPTTSGSGAETTSNAVIYLNKKKYSVENKLIKPKNFLLVPHLTLSNNFDNRSSAGFDAIAQGVESLFSMRSTKESVKFSVESLKMSLNNFAKSLKEKKNKSSVKNMMIAAHLSGKAISISKTTAPHALSYPFTSYYNISHGHAVAITFNEFLNYNYYNKDNSSGEFNLEERFKILFKLTNTQNIGELNKYFKNLKKTGNIKDSFNDLNINIKKNIDLILKGVNIDRLSNNPVFLDYSTIKRILLNKI